MSLGPEKIILILVVALIVFGPQRLPEIARQVGAAVRELRRMQDTVRGELEQVLHPDYSPANPGGAGSDMTAEISSGSVASGSASEEELDHAALPPAILPADHPADHPVEDVDDDGFAGPRSFS